MKTTELKIGDIVDYMGMPCKVTSIYENDVIGIEGDIKVFSSDVVPIYLTKKILEKNGWELKEGEYTKDLGCANGLYLIQNYYDFSTFKSWTVTVGEEFVNTIFYVHEIQHFLWALGLNDEMKI